MNKSAQKGDGRYLFVGLCVVISLVFVLLENIGLVGFARSGLGFVCEPVAYVSSSVGESVAGYFEVFANISKFNQEYNSLKVELAEIEVENAQYSLLAEENESLRAQVGIGDDGLKYIMAKTLADKEVDFLRINKGERDGVEVGDVVGVGEAFVGIVVEVDEVGALVRLPTSRNSHLEVVIVRGKGEEKAGSVLSRDVLSRAVVSGASDGIKIENILMNANVKDGDIVVVNDERVGRYYILGDLVSLSYNPATTSRWGYVSPVADYDDLMTVFVKMD